MVISRTIGGVCFVDSGDEEVKEHAETCLLMKAAREGGMSTRKTKNESRMNLVLRMFLHETY